jgi:uncharacterized protein (TIGR02145 family)
MFFLFFNIRLTERETLRTASNPLMLAKLKSGIKMKMKPNIGICLLFFATFLFTVSSCKKDKEPEDIMDADGNIYHTVYIGTQIWMAENLKTTKFNDSSKIALVTSNNTWITTKSPAYCWYNNDTANKALYGALYNWYAVGTKKLCLSGWHVPDHDEYKALEIYLGMTQIQADTWGWRGTDQGTKLKNTYGWKDGGNGTNSSRFSALAGGYRWAETGAFFDLGMLSYWWTSSENNATEGLYRRLDYNQSMVYSQGVKKQGGKYIRCIKNPD